LHPCIGKSWQYNPVVQELSESPVCMPGLLCHKVSCSYRALRITPSVPFYNAYCFFAFVSYYKGKAVFILQKPPSTDLLKF
jgi:hypothetical protein